MQIRRHVVPVGVGPPAGCRFNSDVQTMRKRQTAPFNSPFDPPFYFSVGPFNSPFDYCFALIFFSPRVIFFGQFFMLILRAKLPIKGLRKGGVIIVKENMARGGFVLDKEDMSVTRAEIPKIKNRLWEHSI